MVRGRRRRPASRFENRAKIIAGLRGPCEKTKNAQVFSMETNRANRPTVSKTTMSEQGESRGSRVRRRVGSARSMNELLHKNRPSLRTFAFGVGPYIRVRSKDIDEVATCQLSSDRLINQRKQAPLFRRIRSGEQKADLSFRDIACGHPPQVLTDAPASM